MVTHTADEGFRRRGWHGCIIVIHIGNMVHIVKIANQFYRAKWPGVYAELAFWPCGLQKLIQIHHMVLLSITNQQ